MNRKEIAHNLYSSNGSIYKEINKKRTKTYINYKLKKEKKKSAYQKGLGVKVYGWRLGEMRKVATEM